jgi:hypothetical protein
VPHDDQIVTKHSVQFVFIEKGPIERTPDLYLRSARLPRPTKIRAHEKEAVILNSHGVDVEIF